MFNVSIKHLKQRGTKHTKKLDFISEMLDFRENCGGEVIGYHGTSAMRAASIAENGFRNTRCIEGGFGVYFWSPEHKRNAFTYAFDKARQDKDDRIAIIKARIRHPEPDWLEARPQWIVDAKYVLIEEITFHGTTAIINYGKQNEDTKAKIKTTDADPR